MSQQIIWTYLTEGEKVAVMALSISELFAFNITTDHPMQVKVFDSKKEAEFYITQSNKPSYYERYGLNYTIKYVDKTSDLWKESYQKWDDSVKLFMDVINYAKLPWYKRLFKKFEIKKASR